MAETNSSGADGEVQRLNFQIDQKARRLAAQARELAALRDVDRGARAMAQSVVADMDSRLVQAEARAEQAERELDAMAQVAVEAAQAHPLAARQRRWSLGNFGVPNIDMWTKAVIVGLRSAPKQEGGSRSSAVRKQLARLLFQMTKDKEHAPLGRTLAQIEHALGKQLTADRISKWAKDA